MGIDVNVFDNVHEDNPVQFWNTDEPNKVTESGIIIDAKREQLLNVLSGSIVNK